MSREELMDNEMFLEFTKFLRKLCCHRNHEPILKSFVTDQIINFGLSKLIPQLNTSQGKYSL